MQESKTYFAQEAEGWDEMRSGYFTKEMRDASTPNGKDLAIGIFGLWEESIGSWFALEVA